MPEEKFCHYCDEKLKKWIEEGNLDNYGKYNPDFDISELTYSGLYTLLCDIYQELLTNYSQELETYNLEIGYSDEEIHKLKVYHRGFSHMSGGLVDFYESDDEDDDGSTVFSVTETLRYF